MAILRATERLPALTACVVLQHIRPGSCAFYQLLDSGRWSNFPWKLCSIPCVVLCVQRSA
jgi:hypothetical protein